MINWYLRSWFCILCLLKIMQCTGLLLNIICTRFVYFIKAYSRILTLATDSYHPWFGFVVTPYNLSKMLQKLWLLIKSLFWKPNVIWFVGLFPFSKPLMFPHTNCHQLSARTSNVLYYNNKMYCTQTLVLEVYVFIVVYIQNKIFFILEYNFIFVHKLSIYV